MDIKLCVLKINENPLKECKSVIVIKQMLSVVSNNVLLNVL